MHESAHRFTIKKNRPGSFNVGESHARSLMKALSWRFNGSLITMLVVYAITGKTHFAVYVGSLEFICKILFFYLHERLWGLIPFGRKETG